MNYLFLNREDSAIEQ